MRVIQEQLEQAIPKASPTLRRALAWLSLHTPEIAWTGLEGVASSAGVSPATVVRAVQFAGYEGYVALQRKVREYGPSSELAWQLFEEQGQADSDIVGQVVADEASNLQRLVPLLRAHLDTLWPWLLERRHLLVVASLMTAGLAEHMAAHLRLLLGNADFLDASSSMAWLRVRDIEPNDGVVALSYPRYAQATRLFLTRARERTRHVLLITDMAGPDHPAASITLRLPTASTTHYSSTVSLMVLMQVIARGLAHHAPDRVLGNVSRADAIWQGSKLVQPPRSSND